MKLAPLLFSLLLLTFNCSTEIDESDEDACEKGVASPSKDSCSKVFNSTIVNAGFHCCLEEWEFKSNVPEDSEKKGKECKVVDKETYDDIKNQIKQFKEEVKKEGYELKKYSIDCQSVFLKIGFASLFAALLL